MTSHQSNNELTSSQSSENESLFYADKTPTTVDTATRSYYETSTKRTVHNFVSHNTSALKLRTSPLTTTNTTPFENPTTLGTTKNREHTSAQFVTTTEHPFTTTETSASKFVNSSIEQYTEYEQVFDDSFVGNHSTVFEFSSHLKHTDSINSTILVSALENANNHENKSTSEKKTIPYGNHTITSQSESSHRERSYKSESVLVGCSVLGGIAVLLLVACAIYMKFGKSR